MRRAVPVTLRLAVAVLLAAGLVAAYLVGQGPGPTSAPTSAPTVAASPSAIVSGISAASVPAPGSASVPTAVTPPDAATMQVLNQQLAAAHQVAVRYPTLAQALADGYTQAAPYAAGIGAHYMKYSLIYLPFNVSAPSMLLFDGDVPTSKIVGLAYYVYHNHGPPTDTFAGPYAHWHQHVTVCVGPTGAHLGGDSLECRGRGLNAWMLHMWVVSGYQTPQAVFSQSCSILQ